jgi:hypothetical protein
MQLAAVEYAKNVCGVTDIDSQKRMLIESEK